MRLGVTSNSVSEHPFRLPGNLEVSVLYLSVRLFHDMWVHFIGSSGIAYHKFIRGRWRVAALLHRARDSLSVIEFKITDRSPSFILTHYYLRITILIVLWQSC